MAQSLIRVQHQCALLRLGIALRIQSCDTWDTSHCSEEVDSSHNGGLVSCGRVACNSIGRIANVVKRCPCRRRKDVVVCGSYCFAIGGVVPGCAAAVGATVANV